MITNAELSIYDINGNDLSIQLSKMQIAMIIKALGLQYNADNTMTMFDDKSLETLYKKTFGRLKDITPQ